jgi:A/G-specific adenine glycosylase
MELGATVCTPRSPYCLTCPVMAHCSAREEGMAETLPVKKKAKPPRPELRIAAFIEGSGKHAGKWLVRQRPQEGLLARMWELPHVELKHANGLDDAENMLALRDLILQEAGMVVSPREWMMDVEHTFSHIHWNMKVYRCQLGDESRNEEKEIWTPFHYRFIGTEEMGDYAFPNVFARIIQELVVSRTN